MVMHWCTTLSLSVRMWNEIKSPFWTRFSCTVGGLAKLLACAKMRVHERKRASGGRFVHRERQLPAIQVKNRLIVPPFTIEDGLASARMLLEVIVRWNR